MSNQDQTADLKTRIEEQITAAYSVLGKSLYEIPRLLAGYEICATEWLSGEDKGTKTIGIEFDPALLSCQADKDTHICEASFLFPNNFEHLRLYIDRYNRTSSYYDATQEIWVKGDCYARLKFDKESFLFCHFKK